MSGFHKLGHIILRKNCWCIETCTKYEDILVGDPSCLADISCLFIQRKLHMNRCNHGDALGGMQYSTGQNKFCYVLLGNVSGPRHSSLIGLADISCPLRKSES